jgi:hypothetical protein
MNDNDEITARAIIPAQPGWFFVHYIEPGCGATPDAYELSFEPIIAWDITRREGEERGKTWMIQVVVPLTVYGGVGGDKNFTAIKRPDGFDMAWYRSFDTETKLIEEFRERRRRGRDRVAAAREAAARRAALTVVTPGGAPATRCCGASARTRAAASRPAWAPAARAAAPRRRRASMLAKIFIC